MSILRALAAFPIAPSTAAVALRRRWAALAAVPVAPIGAGLYLLAAGAAATDAGVAAGAGLVIVAGLAAGGIAGCYPARRALGEPYRAAEVIVPCAVCAAWTGPLFLLAAWLASRIGLGAAAPLVAALAVLVWGTAIGAAILDGGDTGEPGRRLVAVCMGLAGALAGAFLALSITQASLVVPVIVPVDAGGLARGDLLLVRRVRQAKPGLLVLVRDKATGREVLARTGPDGRMEPLGLSERAFAQGRWAVTGRPFFSIRRRHVR